MNMREPFSREEQDRLEQELLELHFGCHPDPDPLQARLAAEPALRALQDRVLQQANLLEQAVRPEQLPLALQEPTPAPDTAHRQPWRWLRSPWGRIGTVAALAASVVLAAFVGERLAARELDQFEAGRLHMTLSAPRAVPIGAPWSFTVQASDLAERPATCRVRWQAFGERDTVLASDEIALHAGTATVAMPAAAQTPRRLEVVAVHGRDEVRQVLQLGSGVAGPLVHVTSDRPVYRPGETLFVRAVALDRITLLPLAKGSAMVARLLDAKGAEVAIQGDTPLASTGSFAFAVPPTSAGGVHRIEVASAEGDFAPEAIEVVVRSFQNPQLEKTIELDRATYGPGARGAAGVHVVRLGGGPAAGAAARGALVIDGTEVWHEVQPLDEAGRALFRFVVPQDVQQGAARFLATITDGGIVETEVRPFVVPTGRVLVAAFPEGGDLVAGVENRVYLECTDPLGRYVDAAGLLQDDRGLTLARFTTDHQGRTRVTFVPRAGRSYSVQLAGQASAQPLPPVQAKGLALQLPDFEVAADAPLRLQVAGRGDGPWLLGVFCRGALVGQTTLRGSEHGELRALAEVPLPASAAGVLRATVFDRRMQPVAERLLRRASAHRVDIELACAKAALSPGEAQQITVRTRDEAGQPLAATVGLSVTDLAAATLGSEPRLGIADHAALFADVERTENLGDFLLGNPAGARHADLLLGTRGWRRFVWRNDAPAKATLAAHGPFAAHLLAREGFAQTPQVASNGEAAAAGRSVLSVAVAQAERRLLDCSMGALLAAIVWVLLEGIALWRHVSFRRSPLPLFAAAALVLGIGTLSTLSLDGSRQMALDVMVDFDAEAPAAAAGFGMPRAVWGEEETKKAGEKFYLGAAPARGVEPAANPLAGAFLDDGVDGDIRGRTENFFEVAMRDRLDPAAAYKAYRLVRQERAAGQPLRQYAHQHVQRDERSDFAPTIFWDARVTTDAAGTASVSFATSDAVTTWLVQADAHVLTGAHGRIGQAEARFTARLPFHLECKLPDEVSAGDELDLPIAAIAEGSLLPAVDLRVELGRGLQLRGTAPARLDLQDGRGRALLPIAVAQGFGTATVTIVGRLGQFTDRVQHLLRIVPRGFPHERSAGGTVAAQQPASFPVTIPDDALPGSGHVFVKLFPSPLTALTEGLQGILQEPHGCFEQASSSNYPNTLVLTLLQASGDDVPAVAARARELLPRGYAKITGYECKERGYEWFGGDPGHEALTAYGLLQFHDMAQVHPVDAGMVERTRNWLLARRDGQGGFQRNARALDQFGGAPPRITDAYVTYALLQAGVPASDLTREIDTLLSRATTDDAYELALIACALQLAQRPELAAAARNRLIALQREDGALLGTTSSITRSGGQDLLVETTSLAVLAWLPDPACQAPLRHAVQFLQTARRGNGTFGATQATIAALRAMTAYAQQNRVMKEAGAVRLYADDRQIAERKWAAGAVEPIEFDVWDQLAPGVHTLRLELDGGGGALPWAADVRYHSERPGDDADTKLALRTALRSTTAAEGTTVALDIEVENRTAEGLPMAMAIVGLPAGLELPTRVLEDLQKAQRFAFWELRGRELALYWRDFAPEGKQQLTLDLTARIPGRSAGPASRTYLYYTPGQKRWAAPLAIEVTAH